MPRDPERREILKTAKEVLQHARVENGVLQFSFPDIEEDEGLTYFALFAMASHILNAGRPIDPSLFKKAHYDARDRTMHFSFEVTDPSIPGKLIDFITTIENKQVADRRLGDYEAAFINHLIVTKTPLRVSNQTEQNAFQFMKALATYHGFKADDIMAGSLFTQTALPVLPRGQATTPNASPTQPSIIVEGAPSLTPLRKMRPDTPMEQYFSGNGHTAPIISTVSTSSQRSRIFKKAYAWIDTTADKTDDTPVTIPVQDPREAETIAALISMINHATDHGFLTTTLRELRVQDQYRYKYDRTSNTASMTIMVRRSKELPAYKFFRNLSMAGFNNSADINLFENEDRYFNHDLPLLGMYADAYNLPPQLSSVKEFLRLLFNHHDRADSFRDFDPKDESWRFPPPPEPGSRKKPPAENVKKPGPGSERQSLAKPETSAQKRRRENAEKIAEQEKAKKLAKVEQQEQEALDKGSREKALGAWLGVRGEWEEAAERRKKLIRADEEERVALENESREKALDAWNEVKDDWERKENRDRERLAAREPKHADISHLKGIFHALEKHTDPKGAEMVKAIKELAGRLDVRSSARIDQAGYEPQQAAEEKNKAALHRTLAETLLSVSTVRKAIAAAGLTIAESKKDQPRAEKKNKIVPRGDITPASEPATDPEAEKNRQILARHTAVEFLASLPPNLVFDRIINAAKTDTTNTGKGTP